MPLSHDPAHPADAQPITYKRSSDKCQPKGNPATLAPSPPRPLVPSPTQPLTYLPSPPPTTTTMKFAVLISTFLLPAVTFAGSPTPMRAEDGTDLSFLLKRYDGPIAILRRISATKRHIVPRTLQVAEVPVRRAVNGLVKRQQCLDFGYVLCPDGTQCCPAGSTCGPGTCSCLATDLPCGVNCQCPLSLESLNPACPRSPRAHTVSLLLQAAQVS